MEINKDNAERIFVKVKDFFDTNVFNNSLVGMPKVELKVFETSEEKSENIREDQNEFVGGFLSFQCNDNYEKSKEFKDISLFTIHITIEEMKTLIDDSCGAAYEFNRLKDQSLDNNMQYIIYVLMHEFSHIEQYIFFHENGLSLENIYYYTTSIDLITRNLYNLSNTEYSYYDDMHEMLANKTLFMYWHRCLLFIVGGIKDEKDN